MKTEYTALVDACTILANARRALYVECDGTSPAWDMVRRAGLHLEKQADSLLRGKAE